MSFISIRLTGIAAELVLGNYMPKDVSIFNNWEDFFHYNDLIHVSRLITEHITEIQIRNDENIIFTGKIPDSRIQKQKSFSPVLNQNSLYLRTECAEQSVFECSFETESFDKNKLTFETQDYDGLFKVGKSFLNKAFYDGTEINPEWVSGKPVGNICLLCRYQNGFLIPFYDAINKIYSK